MPTETDAVDALAAFVASRGRVTRLEVVAHFRWTPSEAVEHLRRAVEQGRLRRVETDDEEGSVAYEISGRSS
ncbi:MAG: hypothetical protein HY558_03235 [Euryarchaeota archaeon]|nr:hypothetical protein [Euryarchaeota archaeon]